MAGGKETPRQKMIGMMYLVLTALLAMNVSKDILNAFVVVNEGLYKSNEIFKSKNEALMKDFEAARDKDKAKVEPFLNLAKQVQKGSEDVNKHIDELKKHLVMVVDKKTKEAADTLIEKMAGIDSKDNYDVPTHIMIGDDVAKPIDASVEWSALQLKKKIVDFREAMVKLFEAKDASGKDMFLKAVKEGMQNKIKKALDLPGGIENGVASEWEVINFNHLPLAAVITNLSKIQTDINNTEADIVGTLLQAVKGKDVTFDKLTAKVIAPSSYILSGDEYKADVLLVAYNSTSNPKIFIGDVDTTIKDEFKNPLKGGGTELKEISAGSGHYVTATGAEGMQNWSGVIEVDAPEGKKYYPFRGEYMVAKPAAAVSPDKMNVFYIGVDNPVSISAAGVAPSDLQPSISGGTLTRSGKPGEYTVRVSGGTEATINVMAKVSGKQMSMGARKFRVKRIPDPVCYLGNIKIEGKMSKAELSAQAGITAKMEGFDFDLKYEVVSYVVSTVVNGSVVDANATGNRLPAQALSVFPKLKSGNKVYIESVKVKGPDGSVRTISGVTIRVS